MKKTLLLSVVASSMIMAGGDIAPVEPVVETPAPVAEASGWDFGGQAVAYTQTVDQSGDGSLFDEGSTYAAVGAQLSAVNKDLWNGIGAGLELSGIHSDNGTDDVNGDGTVSFYEGGGNAGNTSAGVSQAYLTYGMGNTSFKLGRQTLPMSLAPFSYSEGWQMFKNTYDAALVVNSDIQDTTLVYAFVRNNNRSVGDYLNESSFVDANPADDSAGVHMITAQNKSIEGLTLTGTYYTAADAADVIWGDAKFKISDFTVALQGGQIDPDGADAGTAFGAKVGGNFGMFGASVAYSTVSDDGVQFSNWTGVKSPLYTQMVLNNVGQYHAQSGSDFLKLSADVKALGGKFIAGYGMGDNSNYGDYTELDLMYKTKLTENVTAFAAYVYTDEEGTAGPSDNNFVRFWARYNF